MVKLNGKYRFVDKESKEVISSKYDEVREFREGLATVELNKKWGFVDKEGKEVIPLKYDCVYQNFKEGLAIVIQKIKKKESFITKGPRNEKKIITKISYIKKLLGYIDKNGTEYWEE